MINTVKISYVTNKWHNKWMPESLPHKLTIVMKTADNTIKAITKLSDLSAIDPMTKIYRTEIIQRTFQWISCTLYTDAFIARFTSVSGDKIGQVNTNGNGFLTLIQGQLKAMLVWRYYYYARCLELQWSSSMTEPLGRLILIQNFNDSCASFTLLVTKMNHTIRSITKLKITFGNWSDVGDEG